MNKFKGEAMQDLPTISSSRTSAVAYAMNAGGLSVGDPFIADSTTWLDTDITAYQAAIRRPQQAVFGNAFLPNQPAKQEIKSMADAKRRLVQVFVVDPDENVPLNDCLLYRGEQKLTDATDQELFFEIDIKTVLDKHNEKRVKLVNKAVKERVEQLEPAKIRDLKMVVVTAASF